jgi:branched-chain amino acid transport system ATP-binding protein
MSASNSQALVEVRNLVKTFGALVATDNVSIDLYPGEIHAIIGPNGAGKTTLISQLMGQLRPNQGEIRLNGRNVTNISPPRRARMGLARSFQITSLFLDFTALDNVALAVQAARGHSFRFWQNARKDKTVREPAMGFLERLGLQDRADVLASGLSYGERRQLELAMSIATRPSVLLLDEPMAGIAHEDTGRIIGILGSLKHDHAILLVEHDMDAVFQLADRISVLVYGAVIASGTVDEVRANPDVQRAYLGEGGSAHA